MKYLALAFMWILFYILHSLLADAKLKLKIRGWLGGRFKYYRLFYSIIAIITFGLVAGYYFWIPKEDIASFPIMVKGLAVLFAFGGTLIIIQSFRTYDIHEFVGTDVFRGNGSLDDKLIKSGLFGLVRHPMYFGTILFLAGLLVYNFTWATLIVVVISIIYLIIGSRLEERKLVELFGEKYRQYQKEVPMLIPNIWHLVD